LITKLVGMVFGKQAIEDQQPAGLKRMNKTDWPDQYPALVGEDAAPVEGDAPEAAALRPLLKQTQLEYQPLALAYDAAQHGWSADAFHAKLDGLGAAVLVVEARAPGMAIAARLRVLTSALPQTAGGAVCGGYNPVRARVMDIAPCVRVLTCVRYPFRRSVERMAGLRRLARRHLGLSVHLARRQHRQARAEAPQDGARSSPERVSPRAAGAHAAYRRAGRQRHGHHR
jgi:hypothetical protein